LPNKVPQFSEKQWAGAQDNGSASSTAENGTEISGCRWNFLKFMGIEAVPAVGLEPKACCPQAIDSTDRAPSIWAHLGAKFCVRPEYFVHFFDCFALPMTWP
jgi:hypothetical protein